MSQFTLEASKIIDARPEALYAVIADYHVGHPAILPRPFTGITVLRGGYGAGTEVRADAQMMGMKMSYHMVITEPEPGRLLLEVDETNGITTQFIFEPLDGGKRTKVTFHTVMRLSPGFKGLMERLMNPPMMRKMYRQELENLAAYVNTHAIQTGAVPIAHASRI